MPDQDATEDQKPFYPPKRGLKNLADSMLNEQKKHLPSCLIKEKVYKMYEEEMKNLRKDGKRLGYSQFRKTWRANVQDVIIPKVMHQLLSLYHKKG